MEPVLRISGRGSFTITLNGLTSEQAALLHEMIRTAGSGAGFEHCSAHPLRHSDVSSSPSPISAQSFLIGSAGTLKRVSGLIASSGGIVAGLSKKIDSLLDNYLRSDYKIDCKGAILDLGSRTHVMGILNVTPDSFSDGGRYADTDKALAHARAMVAAGADIIDIGGESTRPGAPLVPEEEELARVIPVIKRLAAEIPVPVSIDTYKAAVAKKALEAGASIVNDVSGLRFSPDIARVAADHNAAVIIMHIKGTPHDMQQNPVYKDVVTEVIAYLDQGIEIALRDGVNREKILIDPGIGFGKTADHNLTLLNRLDEFRCLGRPMVLGTSRKKFIGSILNIPVPEQRVDGTAATVALGIERGAHIVRVHDVARMTQVARMTDAIIKQRLRS
jgi:dihydropteroate synthase